MSSSRTRRRVAASPSRSSPAAAGGKAVPQPLPRTPVATAAAVWDRRAQAAQRALVLAGLVLSGLVVWRPGLDNFDQAKLTVVLLAAGLVAAVAVGRVVASRQLTLPVAPVSWAAGAFAVAMVAATAASDTTVLSLFGVHRRYAGLLLYLAGVVLLFAVLAVLDDRSARWVPYALVTTAAGMVAYGTVQIAGADPMGWSGGYGDAIFSTMGNPNFLSGYLAVCTPAVCWLVLSRRPAPVRVAAVALLVLLGINLRATDSDQGYAAAGAGLAVLAAAWLLGRPRGQRRAGLAGLAAAVVVAGAVAAAGLAGSGPLTRLSTQVSFSLRRAYWRAAWQMFTDSPLLGVGPDRYGVHYRAARPLDAALAVGLPQGNDAAHNVWLHLLATGGAAVGLTYAAVVVCTGWALVAGLRRHDGERRLLLGALGGAWLAYLVQAAVSIDVPGLSVLHWVLSGAVVVVAGGLRRRVVPLAPRRSRPPSSKVATASARDRWTPRLTAAAATSGALALAVLWAGTLGLRADTAAGTAERLGAAGDVDGALSSLQEARRLAPWEFTYEFERGDWLLDAGRNQESLRALGAAAALQPGELKPVLAAARVAAQIDKPARAQQFYDQALAIEPQHPEMKVEVAEYLLGIGRRAKARDLIEQALEVDPDNEQALALLDSLDRAGG